MQPKTRAAIAAVCAALAVLFTTLGSLLGGGDTTHQVLVPKPIVPAVVATDGADHDTKPDDPVKIGPEAARVTQLVASNPAKYDMEPNVRGKDNTKVAHYDGPLATPHWPGCETHFLPTNWSERTSSVRALAEHYTAGLNLPGKADMNGLLAYASLRTAGVSWHFLIDAEGHCYYMVPVSKKAWTIGNLNSQTVNIETIGTGREGTFPAAPAGQFKLYVVSRRILKVFGLPAQLGAVNGSCGVTRPGIITHWMGGPCSGGHIDIKPYSIEALAANIAAFSKRGSISKSARAKCTELNTLRRRSASYHRRYHLAAVPPLSENQRKRGAELRASMRRGHYRCTVGPPGKRGAIARR
jgi:hypothetical protein